MIDHMTTTAPTVVTDKGRSENLAALAEYSNAMFAGDKEAVFDFWSEDFFSHVTARVNPDAVGTDVRGSELEWWTEVKNAFPDMTFSVDLLVECGDIIVSNWTVKGTHTGTAFYDVPPSGEPVEINGTGILCMRDGKVIEHWGGPHCQQGLGLIR
jgi:predicted ester cyclase